MIFAEPRFATAILEEKDLAGLTDANEELDRAVTRVLARRPDIKLLFLVGSCPSEVIKLDLDRAAAPSSLAPEATVPTVWRRVLSYSGSGIETTFTQGEDACLAALVPEMPAAAEAASAPSLVVVGALPDVVEDQFQRLFDSSWGFRRRSFRRARAGKMPAVGADTKYLLAQPFLSAPPVRRWTSAAPSAWWRLFRFGIEGTRGWLEAAASAFGVSPARLAEVVAHRREARKPGWVSSRCAGALPASASSSFPDSQLEIPIARFLSRELAMELVEVGTPYLHTRSTSPTELAILPAGT